MPKPLQICDSAAPVSPPGHARVTLETVSGDAYIADFNAVPVMPTPFRRDAMQAGDDVVSAAVPGVRDDGKLTPVAP